MLVPRWTRFGAAAESAVRPMTRVLIVDDDPEELRHTAALVEGLGYPVVTAAGGDAALAILQTDPLIGAVVLDLVMPDRDGMAVLERLARRPSAPPVIAAIDAPSRATVVSALRAGAADFLEKPATDERLLAALAGALQRAALAAELRAARRRTAGSLGLADLLTRSPTMERVVAVCRTAARSPLPLLVEGEPGTGREHLARVVHGMGDRPARRFFVLDCRLPSPAMAARLAEANGGTLLLDEIGELAAADQRLLHAALAANEIRPPGAARARRLDLRLIATSSRRLLHLTRDGAFDPALYNRLNVLTVYLPPLRDRLGDLPLLARHFLARHAGEAGRRVPALSPAALALLELHAWPGNLRELEGALCRGAALATGPTLEAADFPDLLVAVMGRPAAAEAVRGLNASSAPVHVDQATSRPRQTEGSDAAPDRFLTPAGEVTPLADLERDLIAFALRRHGGRMAGIARALGIGRSTLYRKLREHGLEGGATAGAAVGAGIRRRAVGR